MKRIALILITISTFLIANAQDRGEQVLVFRNTGEINLFYSNQLDSIVLSKYDADSILYEDNVSQVFYNADTTMLIPISEIDSVAFGSRNEMKLYDGVRVIDDDDFEYIIRCEGNTIYYKSSSPSGILPKVGERIYSEGCEGLMSGGVSAKVESVVSNGSEIAVVLSAVDIQEIFEKFFYAGDIKEMPERVKKLIRKGDPRTISLGVKIDAESHGNVSANGSLTFDGSAIVDVFRHYYKVNASLDFDIDFGMTLSADEGSSLNLKKEVLSVDLPTIYGVIKPTISLSGFLDLNADLSFNYNLTKHYTRRVIWERNNGVNTWQFPNDKDSGDGNTTANTDLTLNGAVFLGPEVTLDFHVIGDFVGARAKIKAGPEFSGEISMGMLQDLQTYEPTAYGKADLTANMKLSAETFLLNKEGWIWGNEVETKLLSFEHKWWEHKLHLFPEFKQTRSVAAVSKEAAQTKVISNTTKSNTDIERAVEVGFQILDKNENVIDSVFVDSLQAHTNAVRGFQSEMSVAKNANTDDLFVRPVFHYAGYTIPFDKVGVKDDIQIQPMVFAMTRQGVRILSGYPYIGSVIKDSTLYTQGPFQQFYKRDTVFVKESNHSVVVNSIDKEKLIGTWVEDVESNQMTLTFNADDTAVLNGHNGTYRVNYPQTGEVCIFMNDDEYFIYSVQSLTETALVIFDKDTRKNHTLFKQY